MWFSAVAVEVCSDPISKRKFVEYICIENSTRSDNLTGLTLRRDNA